MQTPVDVQIIGSEVAIRWDDGQESFLTFATLRAASPSAETKGERDISAINTAAKRRRTTSASR